MAKQESYSRNINRDNENSIQKPVAEVRSKAEVAENICKDTAGLRPTRICMVTTISKTFDWFMSDLAEFLAANGFEVTVICGVMDEGFAEKHQKFANVVQMPIDRGVKVFPVIKGGAALNRFFKKNEFDIIHYTTPNAALCCTLARNFRKIPVRVYGQWGIRYVSVKGIERRFLKVIEKYICKGATDIFAVSGKNREFALKEKLCKESKISVVGKGGTIGVDFNIFDINLKESYNQEIRGKLGISENEFVFGFCGRLNKDKGINELLGAYRALVHTQKGTRLLLIGMEDKTHSPDEDLIKWARSNESVIFTDYVNPSEVVKYMSACDVLVHPTYREGFSMVLQEAMAMKIPVITTDVPGPSEVIEEGISGALVPSKDEKALLDKMTELMKDYKLRNTYAENGRLRVERYFSRTMRMNTIYEYYCKLLGKNDSKMKFMYLTADPEQAKTAEASGVDRIFLDLEILGKYERQGHLDTVVSHSGLDDVKKLRAVIKKAQLLVRCNPVHKGLKPEIDRIINDGADIIMLPYFKTADEVRFFLNCVGGRVPTVLLFETAEAVENADEILSLDGITEVYIGLNDLHLSYNMKFMFELLCDGTVEKLCEKFKAKGLPYGFGGVAKIGEGQLKSDYILGEHKRLGSTCAILSRTFRNEVSGSRPVENMSREISLLREREKEINSWSKEQFEENHKVICDCVDRIVQKTGSKNF
ncbi:MAG: glycosyltransferase [Clostridia bacterium]|nr:glycosyltransferase [Clostridia bacterium]